MNEFNRLKEDLKQAQIAYHMAAEINQFKAGFLARIAHELRSPISSIMGLHQLILNDLCENPEEERECIHEAFNSMKKFLKIVDEIITVSKIESRRVSLKIIPFSLAIAFADLYELTHLQAANRNLKLEIIPPDSQVYILADLEKFIQILMILIDTAINLSKEGTVQVIAEANPKSGLVIINLNLPCPAHLWQEDEFPPLLREPSLQAVKSLSKTLEMSPTLKFLLAQTLIQSMQGQLQILPENQSENFTQIQCLIPLASTESVAQGEVIV